MLHSFFYVGAEENFFHNFEIIINWLNLLNLKHIGHVCIRISRIIILCIAFYSFVKQHIENRLLIFLVR
jgi:hypothetical protein